MEPEEWLHPPRPLCHGSSISLRVGPRANSLALPASHKNKYTCSSSSERPAKEAGKVFVNFSAKEKIYVSQFFSEFLNLRKIGCIILLLIQIVNFS